MEKEQQNETWVDLVMEGLEYIKGYQISNLGRVKSFRQNAKEGSFMTPAHIDDYPCLTFKRSNGKKTTRYIHKLVAQHFIEKEREDQRFVIHLDYDKRNNDISNLKWTNKKEKEAHQFQSPSWLNLKRERRVTNSKLTEDKVRLLKRKMADPNRKTRLKMLAKQFGISEMQLYRIKKGENWGNVTID